MKIYTIISFCKKLLTFIFVISLCYIIFASFQIYQFPKQEEILQQVQYLEYVTDTTDSARTNLENLSQHNEEFKLFTYAFTTYAITNLWKKQIIDQQLASKIIHNCILNILNKRIYQRYGIEDVYFAIKNNEKMSVLYLGHLNLVLSCYKWISNDLEIDTLYKSLSKKLISDYSSSKYFNLESYPAYIWIPDNAVAMTSIKMYSRLYSNNSDTLCNEWIYLVKANYCDTNTLLPYSTIDEQTGLKLEEPRGSMLSWSAMFIYQMDNELAQSIYKNYKKQFSTNYLVYQLFKERENSWETSIGDIDSGPLFLGYGIPSNVLAMAGAILSDDLITARKIERLINTGAKKIEVIEGQKYEIRFFDYNTSPMAEAIILFVRSICEWK